MKKNVFDIIDILETAGNIIMLSAVAVIVIPVTFRWQIGLVHFILCIALAVIGKICLVVSDTVNNYQIEKSCHRVFDPVSGLKMDPEVLEMVNSIRAEEAKKKTFRKVEPPQEIYEAVVID